MSNVTTDTPEHIPQSGNKQRVISLFWQEFDEIIEVLTRQIRAEGLPDIIVGLERGGLVPAVALSHRLGIRSLLPLSVQRTSSDAIYAAKNAPTLGIERSRLSSISGRDVLVVDDIAGSGETLRVVCNILLHYTPSRIRSSVCIVNRNNWERYQTREPTQAISHVGREVRGWIVFPWEKEYYG